MNIVYLSAGFYNKYSGCKEILHKQDRPYGCVTVNIDGLTFAVPFRHHIPHNHAFKTIGNAGLDYTKAVIIDPTLDIGPGQPQIHQAEFNIIKGKDIVIRNKLLKYIKVYKTAKQHSDNPYYKQIITCSALQYFEQYLDKIQTDTEESTV